MNDQHGAPQAHDNSQSAETQSLGYKAKAFEFLELFILMSCIPTLCGFLTFLLGIVVVSDSNGVAGGGLIAFALVQFCCFVGVIFRSGTKKNSQTDAPRHSD
jgi:hypothetical protein